MTFRAVVQVNAQASQVGRSLTRCLHRIFYITYLTHAFCPSGFEAFDRRNYDKRQVKIRYNTNHVVAQGGEGRKGGLQQYYSIGGAIREAIIYTILQGLDGGVDYER